MSSLRTWFRGASTPSTASATSASASNDPSPAASAATSTTGRADRAGRNGESAAALVTPWDREIADLVDAMEATSLILNDDIDGAEVRLRSRKDSSSFHALGLGLSTFMRSVIGFEKDTMAEASKRLLECETQAAADQKKAQRDAATRGGSGVQIYPPGTEYALVHAEAQLLQAVLAVLHESLTDAVRGFYKLRKAFVTLNTIMELDDAIMRKHGRAPSGANAGGGKRLSYTDDRMPGSFDNTEFADLEAEANAEAADASPYQPDATAFDATTPKDRAETEPADTAPLRPASSKSSLVLVEKVPALAEDAAVAASSPPSAAASTHSLAAPAPAGGDAVPPPRPASAKSGATHVPDADFLTNPVDVFVHSGANMCFGVLLLILSMVPPAFSRLLSIIGFKGDGERGVRMLWNSTRFSNINGGMAGLVLLAYYNGLVGTSDIVPYDADIAKLASPDEMVGYPKERCVALLAHMCRLYPSSALWQLEEARMMQANRRTEDAVALLAKTPVGRIRQITALVKFELGLDAMSILDWTLMRDSFLKCIELNDWSHALYYYNAGCAELELYRTAFHRAAGLQKDSDEKRAVDALVDKHRTAAETFLRKAPLAAAGKRRFMARQMPFDVFVIRKLALWEERAKARGIALVDAVVVSPAQEMLYLWVGSKRMSTDLLAEALTYLEADRCTVSTDAMAAFHVAPDEAAFGSLCRATLLRALGRLDEARTVLDTEIFVHDRAVFKGSAKNDFVLPAAYYEAAVICWEEACDPKHHPSSGDASEVEAFRKKKVDACQAHLDTAAKWEAYVLDARIGRRVQTALDTVQWLKKKKSWA